MAGSSRPAVLIYRQQCKKPFTKRLTGNWGQPYNPPPRLQSAPGRAAALLFDIVDLEGIRGRRFWLWLGLFWGFGTGAFWLPACYMVLVCLVSGFWLWLGFWGLGWAGFSAVLLERVPLMSLVSRWFLMGSW